MKPIRISALAALVALGATVVALGGVGRPDVAGGAAKPTEGITVTGTGSVKAVPDEADFSLGVHTDGSTARAALAANATRMRDVLAALRRSGVSKSDITTQEVSVSPKYVEGGAVNGYTARNSVSVRIRDLAKAGSVLDAASNAGANEMFGPTLSRSDQEELQTKALRSAMANARAKARALADAADVGLGRATAISEGFAGSPEPLYAPARLMSERAASPIEPGTEDIQATVTVTFAIS